MHQNGMTPGPTFLHLTLGSDRARSSRPFFSRLYNISNLIASKIAVYIVLYADDILLMAPSVDVADQLLKSVERELINLEKNRVVYALPKV